MTSSAGTNTNSNFVFTEIFSDKLDSSPALLSQSQEKLLSKLNYKKLKVNNEKETKH
jgi:hypothetical protein